MSPVRSPQPPQRTLERSVGIGSSGGSLDRSSSEDRLQRQQTAVMAKSAEKSARVFMAGSVAPGRGIAYSIFSIVSFTRSFTLADRRPISTCPELPQAAKTNLPF
jgi:hypothetical protein